MPLDNAQFAIQTGQFYQAAAKSVSDYLDANLDALSGAEAGILGGDVARLLSYATTFFAQADQIAFQGSDQYFQQVSDATANISNALKTIDKVNAVIGVAGGIIALGAAITTQSGGGIVSALASIAGAINNKDS